MPLSDHQVVRLHQLLHEARFEEPKGDHLSPAGEYNLRLGVMKELHPELIATHQGRQPILLEHSALSVSSLVIDFVAHRRGRPDI